MTYVELHNMFRTHQRKVPSAPIPFDDIVALQNDQVMYVPDDNYMNPSSVSSMRPTERLLQSPCYIGLARTGRGTAPATEETGIYQSFSGLAN